MKKVLITSKKLTAVVLAMLIMAVSFGFAASAETPVAQTPASVESVRTDTRIYVTVSASGHDFTCSEKALTTGDAFKTAIWNDGGENAVCVAQFDSLKPATKYYIYSRVADGTNFVYSDAAEITTKHSAPAAPVAGKDFTLESVSGSTDLKLTNSYNKADAEEAEKYVLQYSYNGEDFFNADPGANTLNKEYKQGTEYTVYLRFYPAADADEYMSGKTATAKATTWTLPRIASPDFTSADVQYVSDTEIRATDLSSDAQEVVYSISPAGTIFEIEGIVFFTDLTPGTTYVISAVAVSVDPEYYNDSLPSKVTVKTKTAPGAAPAAPVPEKITDTSVTVKAVAGVEFSKDLINWQKSGTFTGLSNADGGKHTIYARYAETETAMPSKTSQISVTLLKPAIADVPPTPVLVSYSNTEIVVKKGKDESTNASVNCEFSIDGGKTWNKTGEFKNLTATTTYQIVARYAVDPTKQLTGKSSKVLTVTTAKRANYKAQISNCSVAWGATEVTQGTMISFVATGDECLDPIAGDTRYVPVNWNFSTDKDAKTKVNYSGSNNAYNGYIPADTPVGKYSVQVNFEYQQYTEDGEWVPVAGNDGKTIVQSKAQQVIVNKAPAWYETIFSYIAIAFSYIGEFLLETIPNLILGAIS